MFISLFFLFSYCKNPDCIINVDGRYVDLSDLKYANTNFHYEDKDFGKLSFRLCGDLIKDDSVPSCVLSEKGWSGAISGKDAQGKSICYPIAATDSFTVGKINDTSFQIQYGSDTDLEPGSVDNVITNVVFNYIEKQTSEEPNVNINDNSRDRYITLSFNINFKFLPNEPTPLPVPIFDPEFVKESQTKPGMGIRFNLSEFKDIDLTKVVENENYLIRFSPGNYVDCPFPYNCRHISPSSLYACRVGRQPGESLLKSIDEIGYCSSFGIASTSTSFDQSGISESDGVYVYYQNEDNSKTAKIFLKCGEGRKLHTLTFSGKVEDDNNQLKMTFLTSDSCIRAATPVPDPERNYCTALLDIQGNGVSIDLRDISGALGYSVKNAKIIDEKTKKTIADDASFFIHPCGSLGCPEGYSCSASAASNIVSSSFWKCLSSTKKCESIGSITSSDVSFEANESVDGVIVRYGSSLFGNKNATIEYACQKDADTPIVENKVTFDSQNYIYKIRIKQKNFCFFKHQKSLSGGAIFLILLACIVFLYAGVGTIVLSILRKEFTFPNTSFWVEFGLCIKEACLYICSCSKQSDYLMKSTYDKI